MAARALIIAGITGDLSRAKLLPALRALMARDALPFGQIIGTTRRPFTIDDLLPPGDPLRHVLTVRQADIGTRAGCAALAADIGAAGEHVFYLSVPPGASPAIAEAAGAAFSRALIVLEKPFGFDAHSAAAEAASIARCIPPGRVYRVDHYLHKRLARAAAGQGQNASAVAVYASESAGAGARADFYERTGALRDLGNHVLSLAALALGGAPAEERLRVLKGLVVARAVRAQYERYAQEAGNPASGTETFFALELASASGARITLASGKALERKYTKVEISEGGAPRVFEDVPPDTAYESVLSAAAAGESGAFLTLPEIMESWRLMDEARGLFPAGIKLYPRGTPLEAVISGSMRKVIE